MNRRTFVKTLPALTVLANTVREMPGAEWPAGDGSLGLPGGFSSTIRADGSQPMRYAAHPELDGAWYRAFDFRRWEFWASNADWEWGPWCTESGWTQPWIAGTLALHLQRKSLWEVVNGCQVKEPFVRLRPLRLPDEVLLSKPYMHEHYPTRHTANRLE